MSEKQFCDVGVMKLACQGSQVFYNKLKSTLDEKFCIEVCPTGWKRYRLVKNGHLESEGCYEKYSTGNFSCV
jgi:hypothetical protein